MTFCEQEAVHFPNRIFAAQSNTVGDFFVHEYLMQYADAQRHIMYSNAFDHNKAQVVKTAASRTWNPAVDADCSDALACVIGSSVTVISV